MHAESLYILFHSGETECTNIHLTNIIIISSLTIQDYFTATTTISASTITTTTTTNDKMSFNVTQYNKCVLKAES